MQVSHHDLHSSQFRPYKPSAYPPHSSQQMAYVAQPHSPHRMQHSSSPGAAQGYSLMPAYSPPVAYHRVAHNASPPLEGDAVVRPLALRRHTSPQQQYATHLMVPPQHPNAPPMYHPNQPHYTHRQVYFPHSPTPVSPSPSSPTLSIVPQFASDDDESGSGTGSGSGSAPSNNGAYVAMGQPPHYAHPHHPPPHHLSHHPHVPPHMQMMQPITHYAMPATQMRQITHVAVPTMQAQPTPTSHHLIQHPPPHMQQHYPHMMHPSHHPYGPPHPGFVMIAAPPHSAPHPQHVPMQRMPMNSAVPALHVDDQHAGTKPKGSKRTATQMREFVRSYFANHSSSLVNKDLSTISHELQVAYERDFPPHCLSVCEKGDRKPVFCRTFIQKVARQMGFLLTLNYGLVDKRMKHLMKIRKRGKKAKKSDADESTGVTNDAEIQPNGDHPTQEQSDVAVKNETNQA